MQPPAIRTTQQRQQDGATLTVYNYDGVVSPDGGESGSENAGDRVASPLAAGLSEELPTGGAAGSTKQGGS